MAKAKENSCKKKKEELKLFKQLFVISSIMDLERIKKKIRPDENAIWEKARRVIGKIEHSIRKNKIIAIVEVGGSLAKGTLIKGDYDVDIFVKFSKKYATRKLSDHLEKILKNMNPIRLHGSRDYFQLLHGGIKYEIVPVYNITNRKEAVNITDASPLHAAWVKENTREKPGLKDEIRLAKLFCKAQGVYGAESYIKGFSGHVLDIITIYYGSFEKLIKNAARWKSKTVIDFYDVYGGDAIKKLNGSKVQSPLIVVDPVDKERNAAAALSEEMFNKFIEAARKYCKKPSEKFFERERFSLEKIRKKNTITVSVMPCEGKKDVVGSKLLRAYESIKKHLEMNGFEMKDSGWHWEKRAYFWYEFRKMKVNKTFVHEGPPVKAKNNFESFKEKYPSFFVKKERAYVILERKFTDAGSMIKFLLKQEFISKNFRSARVVR